MPFFYNFARLFYETMHFNIDDYTYAIEIVAMCVYGFTGVLALKPEKNDLINVILLGLIACCGGGTVRDVLLDRPVFFIHDVNYLIAPILPIIIVFYYYPLIKKFDKLLAYLDGIGLGLFVASSTASVLADGYRPVIAIIMGIITGVFGGILRDVVINRKPMVMGRTFYLTPATIGAIAYIFLNLWISSKTAMFLSFLITVGLRSASIKWDWYLPGFILFKHAEEEFDNDPYSITELKRYPRIRKR